MWFAGPAYNNTGIVRSFDMKFNVTRPLFAVLGYGLLLRHRNSGGSNKCADG